MSSRTDSSVAVSLADLQTLENERMKEEQLARTRIRELRARETAAAEAKRIAEENARATAAALEEERRQHEAIAERARIEARERAAADVARIQAEARAKLELDNAARAHELATLRTQRETGRRFREYGLGAVLAIVLCAAGVNAYAESSHSAKLERVTDELREHERSLTREQDEAKRVELETLDRRHESLLARPGAKQANEEKKTADAARAGLGSTTLGRDRLRTFADSLDSLETRIDVVERLAGLERRHEDLQIWAASVGKKRAGATAVAMQKQARATLTPSALTAYEKALNTLASDLGERAGGGGRPLDTNDKRPPGTCTPDDPGCGLDGRPVF